MIKYFKLFLIGWTFIFLITSSWQAYAWIVPLSAFKRAGACKGFVSETTTEFDCLVEVNGSICASEIAMCDSCTWKTQCDLDTGAISEVLTAASFCECSETGVSSAEDDFK